MSKCALNMWLLKAMQSKPKLKSERTIENNYSCREGTYWSIASHHCAETIPRAKFSARSPNIFEAAVCFILPQFSLFVVYYTGTFYLFRMNYLGRRKVHTGIIGMFYTSPTHNCLIWVQSSVYQIRLMDLDHIPWDVDTFFGGKRADVNLT